MNLIEKSYKRNKIYTGKSVDFCCDTIILPDGKTATREFMAHPGAVAVIPFVNRNNIILVKQYRYPVGKVTYEIPAGKLNKNENPLSCIKRELIEETGYKAGNIKKIYSYWPTPAFCTELLHIYVAKELSFVGRNPDKDEFLDLAEFSFSKALNWVVTGKIRDSKSVIAILLYNYNKK